MVRTFPNARPQGEGEGFHIPEIDDGMYDAVVFEVNDDEYPGMDGGMVPKYLVDWRIPSAIDEFTGEPVELRQFITIPDGLINQGYVSPKSNLYPFLKAMGVDPDQESFSIDPMEWIDRKARLVVKNKTIESGKNKGQVRPQITDVMQPPRSTRPRGPQATPQQPVTATRPQTAGDDF